MIAGTRPAHPGDAVDTIIAELLPFHAASQLLNASVTAPVAFWPRLGLAAAQAQWLIEQTLDGIGLRQA